MDRQTELFEIIQQALSLGGSDLSPDDYRELLEDCARAIDLRIHALLQLAE
ncbi:hypothetical protein [Anatilimnocola floriformis]|uniref:hypothetical protein n=1 Tax=Anatilimnocola floriformis TaxID=2948575 RepID=UPI0020C4CBBB|nr:hypothetical protein [Anatilimnocola floriformis]